MKIVSQVQEDEVIAEFLFAEVNSDRFKEGILHALGDHDLNLLIKPNLNDQAENQIRRDILGQTRGFGRNTRLPLQASKNIMNQIEVFGISNQGFLDINLALKNGKVFPRLIFVSMNENSRVVVLEGHARLTAYHLDNDYIPDELEVIIGFSDKFSVWDLY